MTEFTDQDLAKLTELCRIECSEEEKASLTRNISKIIHYFGELAEVNTEGVEPVYSVLGKQKLILREDETCDLLSRDEFLSDAPSHIGGMIRVPPVFKQHS